jgi:hypothetical protein
MRKTLLVGLVVMVAAVVVVLMSAWFDLELEAAALLGVGVGAVVALVPDQSPGWRLAGFVGGVVVAWVGYLVRAGMLPDSAGGRAVAVGLVVVLAVGVAAASAGRVPLWSALLGAATFAGAFEYTYAAAPPEVTVTAMSAVTTLLFTAAVGFLATALVTAGEGGQAAPPRPRHPHRRDDQSATDRLDDLMMESPK